MGGGTPASCQSPDNHFDSILALDMATGSLKWATGLLGFDSWTVGCISTGANCPPMSGPDFDFGSGVNLFTIKDGKGAPRKVVGAGQKAGIYWLLNADDGSVRWGTNVGVGSSLGGIEWGSATDGKRIYVASSNVVSAPYHGVFAALDPLTGAILWQTLDPMPFKFDLGAVTITHGMMLAGSMSGHMYAFDAANGQILWDYTGVGSSNAGPAVGSDGTVYWGNGYGKFDLGTSSTTFYAFSVNGQ